MNDFLLQGNLYIKRFPNPIPNIEVMIPNTTIQNLQTGEIITINTAEDLKEVPDFLLITLFKANIIRKITELDNFGFYQMAIEPTKITMVGLETKRNFIYYNIEDLNKDFICLTSFLDEATFIGENLNYENEPVPMVELLYYFENMCLVRLKDTGAYVILHRSDSRLKGFKEHSLIREQYDKDGVLNAILNQELLKKEKNR